MDFKQIFKSKIDKAQNILISTHIIPDADGIGSQIGLCMALRELGKNCICVNEEPLLERYHYLDPDNVVTCLEEYKKQKKQDIDLIIIVDTNGVHRVGKSMQAFVEIELLNADILFIDHHPASAQLMSKHCINTEAAATGQVVGHLIEAIGIPFTKKLALPLYTAILIDTSSFRYPTVSAKTHELIAKLLSTGVQAPSAYNGIYGTKKIDHMHLLGDILSSAESNKTGDIAWILLSQKILEKYDTDIEDTHAFINHLLVLDGIKVACMFRDDGDEVKISFRSSGDIDVGLIAQRLGGGGHGHSAATVISKKDTTMNEVVKKIVAALEKILAEESAQ